MLVTAAIVLQWVLPLYQLENYNEIFSDPINFDDCLDPVLTHPLLRHIINTQ